MDLADERYIALTTFKRDGSPVTSPVWVVGVPSDEGVSRIGFYTSSASWKVKRLAHTPKVIVQPSNATGTVKQGSSPIEATAVVVSSGPDYEAVVAGIRGKYGFQTKIAKWGAKAQAFVKRKRFPYADRAVVITLP